MSDLPRQSKDQADPGSKYRLSAQSSLRRLEGARISTPFGLEETQDEDESRGGKGRLGTWWSASKAEVLLALLTAGFFTASALLVAQGSSVLTRGQFAVLALVPLTAAAALLAWVDRLAPLKMRYKLFAVAWGGGVAALAAMVVNSALFTDLLLYRGDEAFATTMTAVVVAPFGEELFKGLGVVLILVLARHHLSSALSAVATAGLVGAGFAYVENLDYFWLAWQEGSTVFGFTVFARAVMSPFIHPMATSFIGLGVGSALIRNAGPKGWVWRLGLGYATAVAIHALWNGLASLGAIWIAAYLAVEIPLFIGWIVWLVAWSRRLAGQIGSGLLPYEETGWLSASEVQVVVNPVARNSARKWARRLRSPAPKLLRKFQRALGFLGMDQYLMTKYGMQQERVAHDRVYLGDVQAIRDELFALETVRESGPELRAGAIN